MTQKEAYRMFWLVKGHFQAPHNTIMSSADGYFKRLWGNHEASIHEEGFEQAYQKVLDNQL